MFTRLVGTLVVLFTLLLSHTSHAEEQRSRISYNPDVDLPLFFGLGATSLGVFAVDIGRLPSTTPAADGLDALITPPFDRDSSLASDIILSSSILGCFSLLIYEGVDQGTFAGHFMVASQSFFITSTVTSLFKLAVRRPRPFTFEPDYNPEGRPVNDQFSFFSGHTSHTAAASFTAVRTLDVTRDLAPGWQALAYGTASALTVAVGILRVTAGKHYPTDVIIGAIVGTAIAWLTVEFHRERVEENVPASATNPLQRVARPVTPLALTLPF